MELKSATRFEKVPISIWKVFGKPITRLAAFKDAACVASLMAIGSSLFGEDNPNLPGDSLAWNGRAAI